MNHSMKETVNQTVQNSSATLGEAMNRLVTDEGTLRIVMEATQQFNWTQYGLQIFISLLGMIFVLSIIYRMFQEKFNSIYAKVKLRKIKKLTGRHVIFIKHTSQELFNISMIERDTLLRIQKALKKFEGRPFDIVLHTPGGEIFSTLQIARHIQSYPGQKNAIIPSFAMSGGTYLALACDSVSMMDTACLGPVDPQLGNLFKFSSARGYQYIVDKKGKRADDQTLSFAFMGQQYTQTMRENLYGLLDNKFSDKEQQKRFVDFLVSGEIEHGKPLTPELLESYGLQVNQMSIGFYHRLLQLISLKGFEGTHYA